MRVACKPQTVQIWQSKPQQDGKAKRIPPNDVSGIDERSKAGGAAWERIEETEKEPG
jgi:hypothetical protein